MFACELRGFVRRQHTWTFLDCHGLTACGPELAWPQYRERAKNGFKKVRASENQTKQRSKNVQQRQGSNLRGGVNSGNGNEFPKAVTKRVKNISQKNPRKQQKWSTLHQRGWWARLFLNSGLHCSADNYCQDPAQTCVVPLPSFAGQIQIR